MINDEGDEIMEKEIRKCNVVLLNIYYVRHIIKYNISYQSGHGENFDTTANITDAINEIIHFNFIHFIHFECQNQRNNLRG